MSGSKKCSCAIHYSLCSCLTKFIQILCFRLFLNCALRDAFIFVQANQEIKTKLLAKSMSTFKIAMEIEISIEIRKSKQLGPIKIDPFTRWEKLARVGGVIELKVESSVVPEILSVLIVRNVGIKQLSVFKEMTLVGFNRNVFLIHWATGLASKMSNQFSKIILNTLHWRHGVWSLT